MVEEEKLSTYIKDLPPNSDNHTKELHTWDENYFVISRVIAQDHNGWETMIFRADKDGEVIHWGEVYGHRGYETIRDSLTAHLGYDPNCLG